MMGEVKINWDWDETWIECEEKFYMRLKVESAANVLALLPTLPSLPANQSINL